MPGRHSERRARRRGWGRVSWVLPLTAALVVGGFIVSRNSGGQAPQHISGPSTSPGPCPTAQDAVSIAASCTQTTGKGNGSANGTGVPRSNGATRTRQSPGPQNGQQQRTGTPNPVHSPSAPPSAPTGAGGTPQQNAAAAQVLALINQTRAQAGLPPYEVNPALIASALSHDIRMEDGCGLSHDCLDEPPLGTRETSAGVHWTSAGENIGEGGNAANSSQIAEMALNLTHEMLNESPPGDGHRQNLLSHTYKYVGIAVIVDSAGTVWMTQDFSN